MAQIMRLLKGFDFLFFSITGQNPAPEKFFNRKGYYSLNCMVMVDHLKRIQHFISRHVGSAHDARIFNESHLKARLEANFNPNSPKIILGDEGYACSRVLLTPIQRDRVAHDHQRDYNRCHKKTWVSVEHSFGIIKKWFPALLYQL